MTNHDANFVARGGIEPPIRGFSERRVIDSVYIDQPVTGASVAQFAALCITMHSSLTHFSRIDNRRHSQHV